MSNEEVKQIKLNIIEEIQMWSEAEGVETSAYDEAVLAEMIFNRLIHDEIL